MGISANVPDDPKHTEVYRLSPYAIVGSGADNLYFVQDVDTGNDIAHRFNDLDQARQYVQALAGVANHEVEITDVAYAVSPNNCAQPALMDSPAKIKGAKTIWIQCVIWNRTDRSFAVRIKAELVGNADRFCRREQDVVISLRPGENSCTRVLTVLPMASDSASLSVQAWYACDHVDGSQTEFLMHEWKSKVIQVKGLLEIWRDLLPLYLDQAKTWDETRLTTEISKRSHQLRCVKRLKHVNATIYAREKRFLEDLIDDLEGLKAKRLSRPLTE